MMGSHSWMIKRWCRCCWIILLQCRWTILSSTAASLEVLAQEQEAQREEELSSSSSLLQTPDTLPDSSSIDPTCESTVTACSSSSSSSSSSPPCSCSVYHHSETHWLHAGRDIPRGDTALDWQNVVIHVTQQDRRAWPLWSRTFTSFAWPIPHRPYEFIFAPALHRILHTNQFYWIDARAANLVSIDEILLNMVHKATEDGYSGDDDDDNIENHHAVLPLNPPIQAAVPIRMGDPLFYPIHHQDNDNDSMSSTTNSNTIHRNDVRQVPDDIAQQLLERVHDDEIDDGDDTVACASSSVYPLRYGPSTIPNVTLVGVFATETIPAGTILVTDAVLHLHRSELYNATGEYHEPLLNYCFGHKATDILFLPQQGPFVHHINHDATHPNMAVQWQESPEELKTIFALDTNLAAFHESEEPQLHLQYVATRDIQAGEELFLNYGESFETALQKHNQEQQQQQQQSSSTHRTAKPFRHEIGLDIFPKRWLGMQVRNEPFPAWNTDKLAPGQIQNAQLDTGKVISNYMYRVGLPEGLADKLEDWADNVMGITDIMQDWLLTPGRMMKAGSEERIRINGGNWWFRRFTKDWQSDLFYITPDDDVSNEQFLHVLADAGFDTVVEAIGREHGLEYLTCFYPSFIAMTHSERAYMHSDSDDREIFNVIFPIKQSNFTNSAGVPEAELTLGMDPDLLPNENYSFNVPYTYERDHAVVLGKDGMHGTAPGDFRGTGKFRMVVSVYMGDFTDDDMLNRYIYDWLDPPYPRKDKMYHALKHRVHWRYDDDSFKLGNPQVNDFSSFEEDEEDEYYEEEFREDFGEDDADEYYQEDEFMED